MYAELPHDEPSDLEISPTEPEDSSELDSSDLDYEEMPCTDDGHDNDSQWEAFIPDDDQRDPEPDPGDFWMENGNQDKETRKFGDQERSLDVDRLLVSQSPCLARRSQRCSH